MSLGLSLSETLRTNPGWFRGDLHAHTHFSDGVLAPPDLAALAREEGLDFLAVTDHNSVDPYPHFGTGPDLLILPGLEVTLAEGHFNVFGLERRSAWLDGICHGEPVVPEKSRYETTSRLMEQAAAEGLLNSINHPLLAPWAWLDGRTDLRHLHCLEIWNDPSWPDNRQANPEAVGLWTDLLNAGYRITAVGGSDFHRPVPPPGQDKPAERLGLPSTYVYAAELSGRAILDGLRRRRAYVSMGARVSLVARAGERTAGIGQDLGPTAGEIALEATVESGELALARLLKSGRAIAEQLVDDDGPGIVRAAESLDPERAAWYRVDVHAADGRMLAITNPIFVGPRPQPVQYHYGDFVPLLG